MILTHGANSLAKGGGDFVEIGGRRYPVVKIGNQLWMAENLDYKWTGLDIGPSGNPSTQAAWYYNNDETNYGIDGTYKCGLLYNWYAAKYLDDNKATLLPSGWHVPSNNEFNALITEVGTNPGTKLKSLDNSVVQGFPSGWNGTDDYGFNALPSGYRNIGSFFSFGDDRVQWSITEYSSDRAYQYYMQSTKTDVGIDNFTMQGGFTIRLVKDAT